MTFGDPFSALNSDDHERKRSGQPERSASAPGDCACFMFAKPAAQRYCNSQCKQKCRSTVEVPGQHEPVVRGEKNKQRDQDSSSGHGSKNTCCCHGREADQNEE